MTNADETIISLLVTGNVLPTPGKLRTKLGSLRLSKNRVKLGNILDTQIVKDTIQIKNISAYPLKVEIGITAAILQAEIQPEILQPQEKGQIILILDPTSKQKYGSFAERISIDLTENGKVKKYTLSVSAKILEDFSNLTEKDLKKAPKIKFEKHFADVGKMFKDESKKIEFTYQNLGKKDLIIRAIDVPRGVETISFTKVLKKNKSGVLKLKVKPKYFHAKINFTVNVYSNDPKNSVVSLSITGRMKKKQKRTVYNAFSKIEPAEARNMVVENFNETAILDVRSKEKYDNGHLNHALNFDFKAENVKQMLKLMDKNKIYFIYDDYGRNAEKIFSCWSL